MLVRRWRPSLEIHAPVAPTPMFLNMAHYFVRSLRLRGGSYRDAPVVLTVGAETRDLDLANKHPWMAANGVEVRWIDEELFARESYYGTGSQRFHYDYMSDVALIMDADVLIAGPLDELVHEAHSAQAVCGVIAHVPPVTREQWLAIYAACNLGDFITPCEHTGWGYMFQDESVRYCPPYFNFGVLAAPAAVMRRLGESVYEDMAAIQRIEPTPYRAQMAVTVAITRWSLPYRALPFRWNFANDPLLEALHADELRDVRIIHLLRQHQIYKNELYASLENVEVMLARTDLRVINQMAQELIREIHPSVKAEA
jgi:hypothetical protein